MSKRIVIAAGGTGGHLFPAQSLANELLQAREDYHITFMAKGLSTNPRFHSDQYSFTDIASGPVTTKALPVSFLSICKGIYQSIRALKRFKPDLIIGFGSYHSFPVLCASYLLGIPIVLHEANSIPGRVNRLFSRVSVFTGIFFPDAKARLCGKVQLTDIPLRPKFSETLRPTKQQALDYYGLTDDALTLLVFGGSLGAKKLNELAAKSISIVGQNKKLQVLHFTGSAESTQSVQKEYKSANIAAIVREFETEMQYAWAASDVCLSRAGASTVAEACAFCVPTIFIPYPHSADRHQDKNAKYVAESIGGGEWFIEKNLQDAALARAIDRLLSKPEHDKMKDALRRASIAMQSSRFSDLILDYLEGT